MSASFGPCAAWDAVYPCDVDCESPASVIEATLVATEVVDALSGRQFGTCSVTIRPCLRECLSTPFELGWEPWPGTYGPGASYYSVIGCGGGCTDSCSCTSLSEVRLTAPVNTITEVLVDGVALDPSSYRVDDNKTLVRIDGLSWPRCNNLNLADTEDGTWSVTATYGRDVPEGGKWAVGELACQLIRARKGEDCRLPASVQRLVRQGVTIEFPSLTDAFDKGYTGLYLVDTFIRAVNPGHLVRRGKTYSVDGHLPRRVGT